MDRTPKPHQPVVITHATKLARPPALEDTDTGQELITQGFPHWVISDLNYDPTYITLFTSWANNLNTLLNHPTSREIEIRSYIAEQHIQRRGRPHDSVAYMTAMEATHYLYPLIKTYPVHTSPPTNPKDTDIWKAHEVNTLLKQLVPKQYRFLVGLCDTSPTLARRAEEQGIKVRAEEREIIVTPHSPLHRLVTTDIHNELSKETT